jgi:hypothetical protein
MTWLAEEGELLGVVRNTDNTRQHPHTPILVTKALQKRGKGSIVLELFSSSNKRLYR